MKVYNISKIIESARKRGKIVLSCKNVNYPLEFNNGWIRHVHTLLGEDTWDCSWNDTGSFRGVVIFERKSL